MYDKKHIFMPRRMCKNWIHWDSCNNIIISAEQCPSHHHRNFLPFNKIPGTEDFYCSFSFLNVWSPGSGMEFEGSSVYTSVITGHYYRIPAASATEKALVQHELTKWPFLSCCYPKGIVRWDVHTSLFLCVFHLVQSLNTETSRLRAL